MQQLDTAKLYLKLLDVTHSLAAFVPELIMAGLVLLFLCLSLFINEKAKKAVSWLFIVSFMVILVLYWQQYTMGTERQLFGMLSSDALSAIAKLLFCIGAVFTALLSSCNPALKEKTSEYYAILSAVLLGASLLVMSANLLMIYLSLELLSIGSYMLAGFGFHKKSTEAAMKYLLFGGVASGIMLYGMSLLYGLTGTLDINAIAFVDAIASTPYPLLAVSTLMVLAGFLFKASAAPLHLWAPDVYEAAPTPVVAFLSVVPKLAGFIVLFRFVTTCYDVSMIGLDGIVWESVWRQVLVVIALLTMTIGNFSALWQNNAKRMLAYSSIAHSGFLMIGILTFSSLGISSLLFYSAVYLIMNFAVFLIIQTIEVTWGIREITEMKGMGKIASPLAIGLLIVCLSLTGLPPTAGFTAKLFIFSALWEAYQQLEDPMLLLLLVFGLLNSVVALFYYIKMPYFMFFKTHGQQAPEKKMIFGTLENYLILFLVALLLVLFFKPEWLVEFFNRVSFTL